MQIQPSYDIDAGQWYVDLEGHEIAAETLRELQLLLPETEIVDYYPDGFQAVREGFLQPSDRHPMITRRKVTQRQIDAMRAQAEQLEAELSKPNPIVPAEPLSKEQHIAERVRYEVNQNKKKEQAKEAGKLLRSGEVNHEIVLNMIAAGYDTVQIANKLNCTIGAIQVHRLKGLRAQDPRSLPTRKLRRIVAFKQSRRWSKEDDKELAAYAVLKLSASQIGIKMDRSRNAVIGRCHRKNIKLQRPAHGGYSQRQQYLEQMKVRILK